MPKRWKDIWSKYMRQGNRSRNKKNRRSETPNKSERIGKSKDITTENRN